MKNRILDHSILFSFLAALLFVTSACAQSSSPSKGDAPMKPFRQIKIENPLAYYEGQVVVSGIYHEQTRRGEMLNYEAGLICFSVKGETEKLIPREKDSRSPWFCFSNTAEARAALHIPAAIPDGTCFIVGTATVRISNYVVDNTMSEVHDTAHLDKVIAHSKPDFKKECNLN